MKTMKKILPVILFLLMTSSSFATGIEGTWKSKMQGGDGEMELTFVFKMVGEKLTGTMKSPNGDIEITNTKINNGKEFSFEISFNDMAIKHNCTLKDDDTISMKVEGSPMGDSEMILKRQQ
jgi:hypothetical protein